MTFITVIPVSFRNQTGSNQFLSPIEVENILLEGNKAGQSDGQFTMLPSNDDYEIKWGASSR